MVRRLVALLLLCPAAALAAVNASVDRRSIEINESFTLTLEVEGDTAAEPDISVLEKDFDVLGRNQSSSTTIVNGRVSRSRTWVISLMARRTGDLTVPPVNVGGEASEPIPITVREMREEPPGEADIFLVSEVDSPRTWVQAQVIYTVKIFIGVSPRQPRLDQPDFDGVEVLVQPLGDDRRYESIVGGRTYTVLERRYALFPQASGTLEIGATRFEARLWEQGRPSGRKVFMSDPLSVEVRPIPPAPASHPDAAWLPALDVKLTEQWDPASGPVAAGEPVSREIALRATGLLANQLPALEPPEPTGVRAYPDQAEMETIGVDAGVQGIRKQRYAIVASADGAVRFDPVELPWWDVRAGEWKVATLEPRVLEILPGTAAPATSEEPAGSAAGPSAGQAVGTPTDDLWQGLSLVLAVGWVLTLVGWWQASRTRRRAASGPREAPQFRLEARRLKAAREACRRSDAAAASEALLAWGAARWPQTPPRSLGEMALRLSPEIGGELETLNRVRYGADAGSWDGRSLERQLKALARGGSPEPVDETDEVLDRLA